MIFLRRGMRANLMSHKKKDIWESIVMKDICNICNHSSSIDAFALISRFTSLM